VQTSILELKKLGRLPSSENPELETLTKYQELLTSIKQPLNNEEAIVLLNLFGPDDCFGLAWTLVNLIETASDWPFYEHLTDLNNEWIVRLKKRASNK